MAQHPKQPSARVLLKWRSLVDEWRGSGLTAREFCKTKGLKSHKTLHLWSSKLNKIDAISASNGEFAASAFVPVEVIRHDEALDAEMQLETIDVHLACGDVICVPRRCDMQQLSQVVAILRKEWQ